MEREDLERQIAPTDGTSAETLAALERAAPDTLVQRMLERIGPLRPLQEARLPVDALVESARDPRWEVRAVAVHALGKRGEAAPLDVVTTALSDDDTAVRMAAVRALGQLHSDASLDVLILALRDDEPEVRTSAIEVLGQMERPAVRSLLLAARCDSHVSVRVAAHHALAAYDMSRAPSPDGALHKVERAKTSHETASSGIGLAALTPSLKHFWRVLLRQPAILQRTWLVPALGLFLSDLLVLFVALQLNMTAHAATSVLAIVTVLSAALGIAFSAATEHDAGYEIALSTATSSRTILFSRFLIVVVSAALLSGMASGIIAFQYHQGLWGIVQLWLGPLLLIASLALALALVVGSWLALAMTSAVAAAQSLRFDPSGELRLHPLTVFWQTSPLVLLLAALCLAFAFMYLPRSSAAYKSSGSE